MITISRFSFDQIWLELAELLMREQCIESRAGDCREHIGVALELKDVNYSVLMNEGRALDPCYAAAEVLWYLQGVNTTRLIQAYAPQYKNFTEDGDVAYGAYGPRMNVLSSQGNWHKAVEELRSNPLSRQAIVPIWRPQDVDVIGKRKDIPCTVSLQYLVRDNRLHAITNMRSNDFWLGLPYDLFAFTCLQRLAADRLGLVCGTYTHFVGSMHMYEKHYAKVEHAITSNGDIAGVNWVPDVGSDDIRAMKALSYEQNVRRGLPMIEETDIGSWCDNDMLYELARVCSYKWGKTPIVSTPALVRLLEMRRANN